MALALLSAATSCNKSEVPQPPPTTKQSTKPAAPAKWIAASRSWPDTLHWVLDSAGEVTADDLFLRLRVSVQKVFLGGPKSDEYPLWARADMTLRPVPRWPLVQGLKMDSVVFYDPIRKARIPRLPMLSTRRGFTESTLRTVFTSDAAVRFTVDLNEGQLLEPTVYFTWDKRTVTVTAPPVTVSFLTKVERKKQELPDWDSDL